MGQSDNIQLPHGYHNIQTLSLIKPKHKIFPSFLNASYALKRVIELEPENVDAYNAKGYCEYMCGNYDACKEINEKALQIEAGNIYAMQGYGIAVYKLGNKKEGVQILRNAVEITGWKNQDLINDLKIMEQY